MAKTRHACANSERDAAHSRTAFTSISHCLINYGFDGFHSIVITASSLPLPLHTGQFFFTRSRCCSPQKKPLPWQYPHEWPLLVIVSFMLPAPTNSEGVTLIMSLFTLILILLLVIYGMVFNISDYPFNRRFNSLFVTHTGIIGRTCFFYLCTLVKQIPNFLLTSYYVHNFLALRTILSHLLIGVLISFPYHEHQ